MYSFTTTPIRILVVEDSPAQCELLRQALAQHGLQEVTHIEHGMDTALAYLYRAAQAEPAALPRLTLVDLKLTNGNGVELVRRLRANRQLDCMPVLMLTTSDNPTDVRAAFSAGANAYVIKPATFEELVGLTGDVCRFWLHWNHSTPMNSYNCPDGNLL